MSSVSVVMAVYNGRRFLSEQVESVLAQLLPGDEFIVVDDASPDGSLALLQSIASPLIRIYVNPTNLGVKGAFERGMKLATHEFIFLCDQDDVWLPGKRAAFVAAFEENPKALVVISDAEVIDAQGCLVAPSFMATRGGFDGSILATLWRNRYLGCAMALRSAVLAAALPIPRCAPMHDMWLGGVGRIIAEVVYLPRPFLQYRRHSANVSPSRRQAILTMVRWRATLLAALFLRMLSCALGLHRRRKQVL